MQKKIAFVLGGMSFGGAERVISILANHYAGNGWKVDIITLLKDECDFVLNDSIRHIHIGKTGMSRVKQAPAWFAGLARYFKGEHPDVVVSFAARINLLCIAAKMLSGCKTTRLVISERNDPMHDSRTAPVRKLTAKLYPKADAIVFQTMRAMQCFSEKIREKGTIIMNPVTEGLPKAVCTSDRIVAVGKLMQQKNHKMLIEAFAPIAKKYPAAEVHIYGDGQLRGELESLIAEKGLTGKVILEGWQKNIAEKIRDARLFVLPSNYEGLSNALMEAYAMGLPCIATDCAGSEDIIRDGETGLIIPVGDTEALTAALEQMLDAPESAILMGKRAGEDAVRFNTADVLKRWEQVIEQA